MREKLKTGKPVIGSWINTGSPVVAELMAQTGFDFLAVDMEHSAVELPDVQVLFQAIRSGSHKCVPAVRLASPDYYQTKRLVDAGAQCVICPLVKTAEQVREVLSGVKYPPDGRRGLGFCRDNSYGLELQNRLAFANEEKTVCVQIEDIEAVRNIDGILAVPGLDAVFIGPYDLSASMGIAGELEHPELIEAKEKVLDACSRHNVAAGIHVIEPEPDQAVKAIEKGYQMIAFSLDITILSTICSAGLATIRKKTGEAAR